MVDLEEFKYGGTNITSFRLVDPNRRIVRHVMNDWLTMEERLGMSPLENDRGFRVCTSSYVYHFDLDLHHKLGQDFIYFEIMPMFRYFIEFAIKCCPHDKKLFM